MENEIILTYPKIQYIVNIVDDCEIGYSGKSSPNNSIIIE